MTMTDEEIRRHPLYKEGWTDRKTIGRRSPPLPPISKAEQLELF